MILHAEGADKWMYDMAEDILKLLDTVYPGYPWSVNVYGSNTGGGYFIRNLDFPANYGMNQPRAHMFGSASEFRADVIKKAGELLERCNLARGHNKGDGIVRMEGVPDKFQPTGYRGEQAKIEAVTIAPQEEERTTPRPQTDGLA